MKSLGLPEPFTPFAETTGADLGLDAEKIWSRKRYAAAKPTPKPRITISEEDVEDILVERREEGNTVDERSVKMAEPSADFIGKSALFLRKEKEKGETAAVRRQ
jgi:hypothetical protein